MRPCICAGCGLSMAHLVRAACGVRQVYRGLLNHVQPVAVKVIPAGVAVSAPRASVETLREITLLRQCRCPHIVQARLILRTAPGVPHGASVWCLRISSASQLSPLLVLCCDTMRARLVYIWCGPPWQPAAVHLGLLPRITVPRTCSFTDSRSAGHGEVG